MKRSKISQCIKEMEKLAKENGFALSPFVAGHRKTGKTSLKNMTKSENSGRSKIDF